MTGPWMSPTRHAWPARRIDSRQWEALPTCCWGWARSGLARQVEAEQRHRAAVEAPGPPATAGVTPARRNTRQRAGPPGLNLCGPRQLRGEPRRAAPGGRHLGDVLGAVSARRARHLGVPVRRGHDIRSRSASNAPRRSGSVKARCSPSWVSRNPVHEWRRPAMPPAGSPMPCPRLVSWRNRPVPALRWPAWPASPWPAVTSTPLLVGSTNPRPTRRGDPQRAVAARAALLRARAALDAARGDSRRAEALHLEALRLRQLLGDNRATVEELEAVAIDALGQGGNSRVVICRGRPRSGGPRWGSRSHLATAQPSTTPSGCSPPATPHPMPRGAPAKHSHSTTPSRWPSTRRLNST